MPRSTQATNSASRLVVLLIAASALLTGVATGDDEQAIGWSVSTPAPGAADLGGSKPLALRELPDGSVISATMGSGSLDAVRHAGDGQLLSIHRLYTDRGFRAQNAVIDDFGAITAWGYAGRDAVMRWNGLDGTPAWAAPFEVASANDQIQGIVVDSKGDVRVAIRRTGGTNLVELDGATGLARREVSLDGVYTAVVADACGQGLLLASGRTIVRIRNGDLGIDWTSVVGPGPQPPSLQTTHLVCTPSGDVVAGGWFGVLGLALLHGDSGLPVWGPVALPSTGGAAMHALAVDRRGDIFVESERSSTSASSALWKVSGVDGGMRFHVTQPLASFSRPRSFLLDARGDPTLFYGLDGSSGLNLLMMTLSGRDGRVLWEETPRAGPAFLAARSAAGGFFVVSMTAGISLARRSRDLRLVWEAPATPWTLASLETKKLVRLPSGGVANVFATIDAVGVERIDEEGRRLFRVVIDSAPTNGTIEATDALLDASGRLLVLLHVADWNLPREVRLVSVDLDAGSVRRLPLGSAEKSQPERRLVMDPSSARLFVLTHQGVFCLDAEAGAVRWSTAIPRLSNGHGDLRGYVDGNDLVLAGFFANGVPGSSFSLKLSGADGHVMWGPIELDPDPTNPDQVISISPAPAAAGPGLDAIIVLRSGLETLVQRLSSATGATQWGPLSVAGLGSKAAALPDPAGDVFLAGLTDTVSIGFKGLRVVKLRASDGVEVLRSEQALTGSFSTDAPTLALLHGGDVWLGFLRSSPGYNHPVAYRLSGSSGAVRWGPSEVPLVYAQGQLARPLIVSSDGEDVVAALRTPTSNVVARLPGNLGILKSRLGTATLGEPLSSALLSSRAASPVAWEIVSGALPTGILLDAGTGAVFGTPEEAGDFEPRFRLTDTTGFAVERAVALRVEPGRATLSAQPQSPCFGSYSTVSVAGSWASHLWLPSGETSPQLVVSVEEELNPAVLLTDSRGEPYRGSLRVAPLPDDSLPAVVAPPDLVVASSTCEGGVAGATPATSAALTAFLAGARAFDTCAPPPPMALPPTAAFPPGATGATVTPGFLFTPGRTEVTFAYLDAAENQGAARAFVDVILRGDVTLDGRLDIFDLVATASALVGNTAPGGAPFLAPAEAADADADGDLDVMDLVLIAGRIAGNVTCLPAGSGR